MKIMIIRLSSIGDIFHTLTIVHDIKNNYPDAQIDWLVDSSLENIVKLSPLVNQVIGMPFKSWKKNKLCLLVNLFMFKKTLNNFIYDYIIDTQGLIKTACLAKYLFTGMICGLDFKSARECGASFFYTNKYRVSQNDIAVIRLRKLSAKIFGYSCNFKQPVFEINSNEYPINMNYTVFLHGTSKANKKWNIDNWVVLAKWVIDNTKLNIVVTFSNLEEFDWVNKFSRLVNNDRILLVEKLGFDYLIGLIKKAKFIIGVDTGLMHLANLLNIPSLAIYLHSNPNYVGILESELSRMFDGNHSPVDPQKIINFIKLNYKGVYDV